MLAYTLYSYLYLYNGTHDLKPSKKRHTKDDQRTKVKHYASAIRTVCTRIGRSSERLTTNTTQNCLLAAAAAAKFAWTAAAAAAAMAWFWSDCADAISALSGALKRPAPLTATRLPSAPGTGTICAPPGAPNPGDAADAPRKRMPCDCAARTEPASLGAVPFATCRPCVHTNILYTGTIEPI